MRELLDKVDVQTVANCGQAKQFFVTLSQGLEQIDFSAAPDYKNPFLSLVTEAASLCESMRINSEITQEAADYLKTNIDREAAEAKWSQLIAGS